MTNAWNRIRGMAVGATLVLAAAALAAPNPHAAPPGRAAATAVVTVSPPWSAAPVLRPEELATQLKTGAGERPLLLHVGFRALYRSGAIPGSRYVGACSRPDGIAALKQAVKGQSPDRAIVIYCGCCPWEHCPNMRPAYEALRQMGYRNVRPLYIAKNLDTDWAAKGYPLEKPRD